VFNQNFCTQNAQASCLLNPCSSSSFSEVTYTSTLSLQPGNYSRTGQVPSLAANAFDYCTAVTVNHCS